MHGRMLALALSSYCSQAYTHTNSASIFCINCRQTDTQTEKPPARRPVPPPYERPTDTQTYIGVRSSQNLLLLSDILRACLVSIFDVRKSDYYLISIVI